MYTNSPKGPDTQKLSAAASQDLESSSPLDQLSAADIAVNIAREARLPEATAVTNTADSENASLAVSSSDDSVVSKPQVISDGLESNKDIIHYTVKQGDTVQSLADKFGITPETIRLSNNLGGDTLTVGMDLLISPVNGLVYRVQPGDTPESVAAKFRADTSQVISFNDVELTHKLKPGTLIVIPDGTQAQPRNTVPVIGTSFSFSFGGVGYPEGWCTYYAAARSGAPPGWGNAATWAYYAALTPGWHVSTIPRVGAIAQTTANHVGIVEWVSSDKSMIKYSDMNGIAGFGRVGYSDKVPAHSEFQNFIYH
ncbi:MAG TPA: LysM peptidoglycan-binding domain-containing protein [Candidatus Saccharimonadales bacterium]|nr:LysM peptidoglycan-binding domain-containing protein [Candidatus Saccharimonadales bacterium]